MAVSADDAIRIRNLTVSFSGRAVVETVSFDIPRGSVFAFIGPNGSGKTTTIRAILGLQKPNTGEIELNVGVAGEHRLKRVGVLFDRPWLYPHLTADENIRVVSLACGVKKPDTAALLASVGLRDCRSVKVRHFSTGMRQRLGFALALLNDPDLLVLDELLNGLDPGGVKSFREFIERFADSGKTVLWSSHQLGDVQRISTHVAFMSGGRLLYSGPLADIVDESRHALVTMTKAVTLETLAAVKRALEAGGFGVSEVAPFGVGDLETTYAAMAARWPS